MGLVEKRSFWSFLKQPWWIAGWMLTVGFWWQGYENYFAELGVNLDTILVVIIIAAIQYFTWPIGMGIYLSRLL